MAVLCGEPGSSFLLLAVRRSMFKKNPGSHSEKFFFEIIFRILQLLGPILLPGGVTQLFLQFIDFAN
jgi:hypothetical protein